AMGKSLIDYIFRFLGARFLSGEQRAAVGLAERDEPVRGARAGTPALEAGETTAVTARVGSAVPAGHPIGFATGTGVAQAPITFSPQAGAPSCPQCGSPLVRNRACYKGFHCGAPSGCP